jgi:Subtilase family
MKTRVLAATALSFLTLIVQLCSSAAAVTVSPLPASDYTVRPACAPPAPGHAGCLALVLVPRTAQARAHTRPLGMTRAAPLHSPTPAEGAYGLRPQDLHNAYRLPTAAISAQTIAIVDAFADATAEHDLGVYDQEFGLPECTAANTCFEQVNQKGETGKPPIAKTNREKREAGEWALETSLDVEDARAVCQSCRIMLVEAGSASFSNLEAAESAAAKLGATEISNSWGGPELGETPAEDDASPFNHPGIVITAAAGDDGYLDWDAKESSERGYADYPASSPHVVAVGGTRLSLTAGGAWKAETAWNGDGAGGGGCSVEFAAPAWQQSTSDWSSVGCGTNRAVADVSADADPYTGVAVYDSTPEGPTAEAPGWTSVGGTSASSPLIASVFALAGGAGKNAEGETVAYPAQTLYENLAAAPGELHDVVSGSNGACTKGFKLETGESECSLAEESASCSVKAICVAGSGYDGPTGVGTPHGIAAFESAGEAARIKQLEEQRTAEEKQAEEAKLAAEELKAEEERQAERKVEEERRAAEARKAEEEQRLLAEEAGTAKEVAEAEERARRAKAAEREREAVAAGSPPNTIAGAGALSTGPLQSPSPAARPPIPILSAPALTKTATAALSHGRPRASRVAFAFTLNVATRVHVTLAKQVAVHGRTRWQTLPVSLTLNAAAGRNGARLNAHGKLAPGRYRLTLAPTPGVPRSLAFRVG